MADAQYKLIFSVERGFLRAIVSGVNHRDRNILAIQRIAGEARRTGNTRVLIQSTGLTGTLEHWEQYDVARQWVSLLFGIRTAMVRPADRSDDYGERAVVAFGEQMKVFVDEEAARAWLLNDRPTAA